MKKTISQFARQLYFPLLLLPFMLFSCASAEQKATPIPDFTAAFAGRWQIDLLASDDVRGRLLPLFERKEMHWRRRADRIEEPLPNGESGPSNGDDGISTIRWMQHERQKEIQSLLSILTPATQLDVRRAERSIRIATDKGEGTRVLTPGEVSSLILVVGGFTVTSLWEQGGLTIESRGTGENKVRIVERYVLRGQQLEERLDLKVPEIGKQSFRVIYKRAP